MKLSCIFMSKISALNNVHFNCLHGSTSYFGCNTELVTGCLTGSGAEPQLLRNFLRICTYWNVFGETFLYFYVLISALNVHLTCLHGSTSYFG